MVILLFVYLDLKSDGLGGVMVIVSVLSSCAVISLIVSYKRLNSVYMLLTVKHTTIRQDNMFEWSNILICGCCFSELRLQQSNSAF